MSTTPTGIPVTECQACGLTHPVTRRHCTICHRPSAFIDQDGRCIHHREDE